MAVATAGFFRSPPLCLPGCLLQEWILGDWWVRTGNLSVGNAEAIFFWRVGGLEGETGTSRDTVASACFLFGQRGKKRDRPGGWGGGCPTSSKRQFAPLPPLRPHSPLKRIIWLNLGCVQHQVIRYYWGGGWWRMDGEVQLGSQTRALPGDQTTRQTTGQTVGAFSFLFFFFITRGPRTVTGCWHLPGVQVTIPGQHHPLLQTMAGSSTSAGMYRHDHRWTRVHDISSLPRLEVKSCGTKDSFQIP